MYDLVTPGFQTRTVKVAEHPLTPTQINRKHKCSQIFYTVIKSLYENSGISYKKEPPDIYRPDLEPDQSKEKVLVFFIEWSPVSSKVGL